MRARRNGLEHRAAAAALAALTLVACAGAGAPQAAGVTSAPPPAVLDALLSGARTTRALEAIAAAAQLPAGEPVRVVELGRDAHTSHHVVAIRDRESPHRHAEHDLLVILLRGHGFQLVAAEERPVGPGSILYIPRGTLHAFRNASAEPAVAYVVYLPPRA